MTDFEEELVKALYNIAHCVADLCGSIDFVGRQIGELRFSDPDLDGVAESISEVATAVAGLKP